MKHALLILALALTAFGCSDKPTQSECEKLLDHTVRLQITEAGGEATDARVEKLKAAANQEFVEHCLDKIPRGRLECALKATSKKAIAACDGA